MRTGFGSITIDGREYEHDVVVGPDGIREREKWISKERQGTSHRFTRQELTEYLEDAGDVEVVVVGTGQYGRLSLLDEARELLREKDIELVEAKTPRAIKEYERRDKGITLGIFHVTC